jgi:hypothetical protein
MLKVIWFLAGALALLIVLGGIGEVFLKTGAHGFSAREN